MKQEPSKMEIEMEAKEKPEEKKEEPSSYVQ